jgi:hypothetical protein
VVRAGHGLNTSRRSPRPSSTVTLVGAPGICTVPHVLAGLARDAQACRMLVCERCSGKILAHSPDEAGGDIATWSCTPREVRASDRYWWIEI